MMPSVLAMFLMLSLLAAGRLRRSQAMRIDCYIPDGCMI